MLYLVICGETIAEIQTLNVLFVIRTYIKDHLKLKRIKAEYFVVLNVMVYLIEKKNLV